MPTQISGRFASQFAVEFETTDVGGWMVEDNASSRDDDYIQYALPGMSSTTSDAEGREAQNDPMIMMRPMRLQD